MKVGGLPFNAAIIKAIDWCFEKCLLSAFSYKVKTKDKFINLHLFSLIYGKLF